MPKKKTGQRKKAEKCRERQKLVKSRRGQLDLNRHPANGTMECSHCGRQQKIRAFCYFCSSLPRLPQCCNCGKQKCLARSGDCLVKHPSSYAIGLQMVGAICDFCEAWVCHSAACILNHSCDCPMRDAVCVECNRTWLEHGGRMYRCAFCERTLCEDDQFEHQASCQRLDAENYKCPSCNRTGSNACLRCKLMFCDEHIKRKGVKYDRGKAIPCPRCGYELSDSYSLSVSARSYDYGRQTRADDSDSNENYCDYKNDVNELSSGDESSTSPSISNDTATESDNPTDSVSTIPMNKLSM